MVWVQTLNRWLTFFGAWLAARDGRHLVLSTTERMQLPSLWHDRIGALRSIACIVVTLFLVRAAGRLVRWREPSARRAVPGVLRLVARGCGRGRRVRLRLLHHVHRCFRRAILALGGLLLPSLLAAAYERRFATGLLTASGSIGLLFQPSLPVILYGVVAQVPIDGLFLAAWKPGALLMGLLFLAALNVFLLAVGCLMDIFSAITVVAPLVVPLAIAFDIDPRHLGVLIPCCPTHRGIRHERQRNPVWSAIRTP